MNAKEAVAARILALCDERGIAINALASCSGVAPSTVYSMLNAKSQNPGKSSATGWEFPSENSLMMTSLTTSSRKSSKKGAPVLSRSRCS